MPPKQPTAGVIIIGNELLSGKIVEANAAFLIGRLRQLGVRLERLTMIPDEHEDIVATVREFSTRFDAVFTTGGIGPTHDDLTIHSVAQALDGVADDAPLLVLCRSGARSAAAGAALLAAGRTDVHNVVAGFEGDLDPAGHRHGGWKDSLPWRQG